MTAQTPNPTPTPDVAALLVAAINSLPHESIHAFAAEHAAWSQATFGADAERGPLGPLNHLAKEVSEAIANPTDITEYADLLMLTLDAARRAGYNSRELLIAARRKLEINKARRWQTPNADGSVEHLRPCEGHAAWECDDSCAEVSR